MRARRNSQRGKMKVFFKHYNIMTSCDEALLPYVTVQLASISSSLPDARTDFYLIHRGLPKERLEPLHAFCRGVGNLRFHSVRIDSAEAEKYDAIAARGGAWPGEAYFSLNAGAYLPKTENRVLYLDAGDVLVNRDIAPFYNAPFENNAVLTVHCSHAAEETVEGVRRVRTLTAEDLRTDYDSICRTPCLFNSGSYVINLARLREDGKTLDDYVRFAEELCDLCGQERDAFWGDQGFLSALYAGRLHYYGFAQHQDTWYRPYDFVLAYYFYHDADPADYDPAVIHYCGTDVPKPWTVACDPPVARFAGTGETVPMPPQPLEEWYRVWQETARAADNVLKMLGR